MKSLLACTRLLIAAATLSAQTPAPKPPPNKRLVVAGDASSIARPVSGTARDRTYVHQSNLPEGCKPVTPGWQFSFVAVFGGQ